MGLRTKDLIGADQRSDNNKIGYTTKSALCNTRFRIPPCPIFWVFYPDYIGNWMLVHINMQVYKVFDVKFSFRFENNDVKTIVREVRRAYKDYDWGAGTVEGKQIMTNW